MKDLPPRRFRLGAWLLDVLGLGALFGIAMAVLPDKSSEVLAPLVALHLAAAPMAAWLLIPGLIRGSTVGQWLLSSKNVTASAWAQPGLVRFAVRLLVLWLTTPLLFLPVWFVAFRKDRRGPHDLISGIQVVADESMGPASEPDPIDFSAVISD